MTQLESDLSRLHGDIARAGMSPWSDGTILVWQRMYIMCVNVNVQLM